eukprot:maker-scaffold88_size394946-snap-gene-0.9 protein:Tk05788 transcript:maker-scaffold88_size394946-snap-gene-0.9-mRNA-1 annotation:"ras-related protein rab-24"
MESDFTMKVVILGPQGVGKSSLIQRFALNEFDKAYVSTIGVNFESKVSSPSMVRVKMNIWDTSGQDRFQSISRAYYNSAQAAIICFDLTNETSWHDMKIFLGGFCTLNPNSRLYVCGTKFDILEDLLQEPCVDPEVVDKFAESLNVDVKVFVETSSKLNTHVEELFRTVAIDFLADLARDNPSQFETFIPVESQKWRSWCCSDLDIIDLVMSCGLVASRTTPVSRDE